MPDRRCAQLVWASICLIVTGPVGAQGVCWAPPPVDVAVAESGSATDTLDISARGFAGVVGGTTEFSGDVSFSFRGNAVSAEQASVSSDRSNIELLGSINIESPEFAITGDDARVDRTGGEISISRAELTLLEMPARARADDIVIRSTQTLSLRELHFTTCPVDDVDWELVARALEIDTDAGFGKARGVVFRFKGVPLIYLPVLSFPVDERRKSGFLTPEIAERDRTGFDLTLPYYLNLAENYDLLLEPRYMSERGVQIGSNFRYLMPATDGSLAVEYMRDDRSIDRPRLFVNFEHASSFGAHWDLNADIENVSDAAYFEDLGDSLGSISQTHLDRFIDLGYYAEHWSMITRMHEYQTIDSQIAEADRPYERKPQVYFSGAWGDHIVGFDAYAEAVDFDRTVGETGWRFDSMQELSLRFARGGFYLTPAIGVRQTSYRIDRTPTAPARNPSRNLPVASLDTGLRFERSAGRDRTWTQTIEPRLLYVRIPYEDQSSLPVFDTLIPDFNLVQLFSKFQFVGADRIADANRVSYGLTTRLFSGNGRERVSATIGQTRFRDPRRVLLPDETALDSTRSNYVARLEIGLQNNWNLDLGYQWNGETAQTVRSETRFEYRPAEDRVFGLGYRMREGLLEQGDLSLVWPVGDKWRLIGQYSYSLLEKKALESLAGLEYEACCWLVRLTGQRYIVRSTGETDNTISIQLELKGLGPRRATPEELLGRGILGSRSFARNPEQQ